MLFIHKLQKYNEVLLYLTHINSRNFLPPGVDRKTLPEVKQLTACLLPACTFLHDFL